MNALEQNAAPTAVARALLTLNTSYFQAKALQSAVELRLFDTLAEKPLSAADLCARLGLDPGRARDFLDALVGLGVLGREEGVYANRPGVADFLVSGGPRYLGESIAQHSRLHYRAWGSLTQVLTGQPAEGQKDFRKDFQDLDNVRRLMGHMDVFNSFVADELDHRIDWSRYSTFLDVGGARGNVAAHLARTHGHLTGGVFDLPAVKPLFEEHMAALGTTERVRFTSGDFFADPLPEADVVILGHVLHDWPADARGTLLERTYEAVRPGGLVVVYDAMLDDDREDPGSLLQSLNCSIMRNGGSEYTVAECRDYAQRAGFGFVSAERIESLTGDRLFIAEKPA
ncbi:MULTISPECIES: methyltransferase [unclassified Streptomyces]|uniref:methyltransferase n=1 Tax=unclassified Streptomyces TaxID=2593676 RepID=UPI0024A8F32D|nr:MULTISPECIES: methyltransferase [unclassified Streptomyces]